MQQVQIAVIGAGSAGLTAYRQARRQSDSVLLIDPGPLGTTCARVGCMPSKLLIAAADAAWEVKHAREFGIHAKELTIDGNAVMQRVQKMRDQFVGKVLKGMESIPAADRLAQKVHFISDHQLQCSNGEIIDADRIVIATGSSPHIPSFLKAAGDRLLLNDTLFDLPTLPDSVAVFGPGVVGLELGQALSRLGVRVRMFGVGGAIGPLQDEALRDHASQLFNREFPLDADANVKHIEYAGNNLRITFIDPEGNEVTEPFCYLLAATGRRPNLDALALENTSLSLNEQGTPLFNRYTLQTSLPHIFIAGDANNDLPLLHEAADEGAIAGRNAASYPNIQHGKRTTALAIVFSSPQIATLGQTLEMAKAAGPCVVATFDFAEQARARVQAKAEGAIQAWADAKTGKLLGAEMLGPDAEHLAHLLAWAIEQQQSVNDLLAMPYYHPVLEEGLRSLLRSLKAKLEQQTS